MGQPSTIASSRLLRACALVALAVVFAPAPAARAWPPRTRLPEPTRWELGELRARSGRWRALSFDGHVHTDFSHDARHPIADVMDLAERVGLDAVVVTDHGSAMSAGYLDERYAGPVATLLGQEIGGSFGHAVLWNVRTRRGVPEAADESLEALAAIAHAEGGLVVLAHPGWWIARNDFDPRRWMQYDALRRGGIAAGVDALELWNQQFYVPSRALVDEWAALLDAGLYVPVVGDSDFHILGQDRLGEPRNVFFCRVGSSGAIEGRVEDCLLDAVRAGRLYVTDGPTIAWTVAGRMPGEIVPVLPGTLVAMHVEVVAPEGGALEVFVGAERAETVSLQPGERVVRDFALRVPARDSFVRVEIARAVADPDRAPFSLLSNPVRLDVLPRRDDGWRGPEARHVRGPSGFRRADVARREAHEAEREAARAARRARRAATH